MLGNVLRLLILCLFWALNIRNTSLVFSTISKTFISLTLLSWIGTHFDTKTSKISSGTTRKKLDKGCHKSFLIRVANMFPELSGSRRLNRSYKPSTKPETANFKKIIIFEWMVSSGLHYILNNLSFNKCNCKMWFKI